MENVDLVFERFTGSSGPLTGTTPSDVGTTAWQASSAQPAYPIHRSGGFGRVTADSLRLGENYIEVEIPASLPVIRFLVSGYLPQRGAQVTIRAQALSAAGVLAAGDLQCQYLFVPGGLSVTVDGNLTGGGTWATGLTTNRPEEWMVARHAFEIELTAAGGAKCTTDGGAAVQHATHQFAPNDGTNFTCWGFRVTFTLQNTDIPHGLLDPYADALRVYYGDAGGSIDPGDPPSEAPDALFYDSFSGGAGPLRGHQPDYNVVANSPGWHIGADEESARYWYSPPYSDSTLVISALGGLRYEGLGGTYGAAKILDPGRDSLGDHYPYPADLRRGPYIITWTWRDSYSSVDLGSDYRFWLRFNPAPGIPGSVVLYRNGAGTAYISIYGSDQDDPVYVTFDADTDYTGMLIVDGLTVTLNFLGIEVKYGWATPTTESELKYGELGLDVFPDTVITKLMVRRLPPRGAFWTGFVNTHEVV